MSFDISAYFFFFIFTFTKQQVIPTHNLASVWPYFHWSFHLSSTHTQPKFLDQVGFAITFYVSPYANKWLCVQSISSFVLWGTCINKRCIPLTFSKRSYSTITISQTSSHKGCAFEASNAERWVVRKRRTMGSSICLPPHIRVGFAVHINRHTNRYPICDCLCCLPLHC